MRFPVLDASDAEGLGRDHPWCSGGEVRPRCCSQPGPGRLRRSTAPPVVTVATTAAARWARSWPGWRVGQTVGEDEIVTLFAARGPEVRAVAEVADQLRRRGGRRRGHLRGQPEHQLHQRLHVQVQVLRLLQGPALAQPPGHALPARAQRDLRPGARGRGAGRHRGLPPGRHPSQVRRRLLPRGHQGGPGGLGRPSTSTGSPPWR